jgi:hypothetical protein
MDMSSQSKWQSGQLAKDMSQHAPSSTLFVVVNKQPAIVWIWCIRAVVKIQASYCLDFLPSLSTMCAPNDTLTCTVSKELS